MAWLFSRETTITLAVLGATASTLASLLEGRGRLSPRSARRLNALGYALMTLSMICFIIAGLRAPVA